MKGDFSRRTFDPANQYSAVLQEQGRMLTDADLEEEHRILAHRIEAEAADLIGGCGGPLGEAGFEITDAGDEIQIGPGRYYVDGILVENYAGAPVPFSDQPDRPGNVWPAGEVEAPNTPDPAITGPGRYLAYLDVWRRLITALDDPGIREVALGGPTTAARERTVWQVRLAKVDDDAGCLLDLPEMPETTGMLAARATPEAAMTDPCEVPPGAGFKGLENQFYRVEVHRPGSPFDLTLDPNPDVFEITGFPEDTSQVTLSAVGDLEPGQPVEVYRAASPLESTYAEIVAIDGDTLTLNRALSGFSLDDDPMLRRVGATFVWSRDNGSIVTTIERIDGDEITVHDLGRDDVLGFKADQWVEITDDRNDLEGTPGQLLRIASIDKARRVIVLQSEPELLDPTTGGPGVNPEWHPKLRRWDGAGGILANAASPDESWIHLEDGVQVRFTDGNFVTGDYWHFPARTAIIDPALGNIEWPRDDAGEPLDLPPYGIEHHYCKLAMVDLVDNGDGGFAVDAVAADCRNEFPPVTELTSLLYVGGDGQEGVPDPADRGSRSVDLGAPLQVRVANGAHPVPGATVRFSITATSNGRLQNTNNKTADVVTDADGIASCIWQLDGTNPVQFCQARLLTGPTTPPVNPPASTLPHQAVNFTATLSTAGRVSYDPRNCPELLEANVKTVQQAIDALCGRRGGGRCCCVVIGPGGDFEDILQAVEALLERGTRDICLCLMPGDHVLSDLHYESREPDRDWNLSISGCGPGVRLFVEKRLHATGLAGFELRDLDITLQEGMTIDAVQCHEVTVDRCLISGLSPEVGLVRIHLASRIYVGNSTFEAFREPELLPAIEFFEEVLPELTDIYRLHLWREFAEKARGIAIDLSQRDPGERRDIAERIRERLRGMLLSLGEVAAYRRLAETLLLDEVDPLAILDHLIAVRRAVLRLDPAIALEIGTILPGPEDRLGAAGTRDGMAVIENNDITGLVSFYGPGGKDNRFDDVILRRLAARLREPDGEQASIRLRSLDLDVHVRDNRLTRFSIGQEMFEAINDLVQAENRQLDVLYSSIHCTDNVIDGATSQLVARHLAFTSNEFALTSVRGPEPGGEVAIRVANVVGDTAVYTGNHGRRHGNNIRFLAEIFQATRANAGAANLEIALVP